MSYIPRPKPSFLDLPYPFDLERLKDSLPSLMTNADTMFRELYQDLQLISADISSVTNSTGTVSGLTLNHVLLGGGGSAIVPLASLGTTTTVLHGNAAGAPTFGAVVLTTDVSGILPVANGGSGTGTTFTKGSVIFAGTAGVFSQDNAKFFWDDTNFRLGVGLAVPLYDIDVTRAAAAASVVIQSKNSDSTGTGNLYATNDLGHSLLFQMYGSAFGGTVYGISKNDLGLFEYQGASGGAFILGTSQNCALVFGTARNELARFTSTGFFGINKTAPLYKLDVVGPGGSTAGSLTTLITDNNSHDGMNFAIGWTGAGAGNKYKVFNIDSNGFHIGHMTDALNASPTLDFSITNAGACKAETEMQSVLYDFGASTAHITTDAGADGTIQLLSSGGTTFGYLLLGKNDATGVRVQFNASSGITLVNGNNSLFNDINVRDVYINVATYLIRSKVAWTDHSAAQVATLTNGPAAGNPTKWIAIDDNGTTRYIPAW